MHGRYPPLALGADVKAGRKTIIKRRKKGEGGERMKRRRKG